MLVGTSVEEPSQSGRFGPKPLYPTVCTSSMALYALGVVTRARNQPMPRGCPSRSVLGTQKHEPKRLPVLPVHEDEYTTHPCADVPCSMSRTVEIVSVPQRSAFETSQR